MTPEERKALREKHAEEYGICVYCMEIGADHFNVVRYPCDVIKVLDWAEAVAEDLSARIEGGP